MEWCFVTRREKNRATLERMRIFGNVTAEIIKGEFGWTLNATRAKTFATALQAIAFIIQRQIGNAELIVEAFEPVRTEITVPV